MLLVVVIVVVVVMVFPKQFSRNLSMEARRQDAREVIKRKVPAGRMVRGEEEEEEEERRREEPAVRRVVQPRRRLGEVLRKMIQQT